MAKKLCIIALGVMLLAAFAAPAMAETKVQFKGQYRVRYQYVYNTALQDNGDKTSQQDWFDQRFRIEPSFIVSDNLRLVLRIDGLDGLTWGSANAPDALGNNGQGWNFERAYMVIDTAFGQFRVGRQSAGTSGLYNMGYAGGMFASETALNESAIFDSGYDGDAIVWSLPIGNLNITAVYEKLFENDTNNTGSQGAATSVVATNGLTYQTAPGYDDDQDFFLLVPSYKWSFGQANLTMIYIRGRATGTEWINSNTIQAIPYDFDQYSIEPAVRLMFGPFNWNFEFQYRWANVDWNEGFLAANNLAIQDRDQTGWGLYTDFIWTYGPGQVGMMFHYLQGPDYSNTGTDDEGILTSGGDHCPFLVAYNYGLNPFLANSGIGNSAQWNNVSNGNNQWMLGLWVDHNLTENLMMHAALGYIAINELPMDVYNAAGTRISSWDEDTYGVEFDLGLSLKLMEGLNYQTLFGYFWPGDYNQAGVAATGVNTDLGSAYAWKNQLVLSF